MQARNSLTELAPNARALMAHGLLWGQPRAMRTASDSESDLYRAVVAYLDENPEAMDTLEGIAEWWVMRQRIRSSVSTVAFVVRQLVEDGLLEEVGPRERPCFRLKRAFRSGRGARGH